jgi:glyoxylase-like metal-dependent hydrolase (beta-lactamase superfamily II)/rhodanese-related sulfurtransferase
MPLDAARCRSIPLDAQRDGPMHIKRFFVPGLAHASYLVASGTEAVVIDPERNVGEYLDYLAKYGLKLRYIFLTHPHADFVAGHAELSARSGAPILISERAAATFTHRDLKDGDRITLGRVEIEVIATPGHSPDSICLCLYKSCAPVALFSGDTLFAGDVGRPDLRDAEIGAQELAGMLYDSLFHKLLRLPAEVKVYPGHGAGSLCGRKISSAPFTTIGEEAKTNWAFQLHDRASFVEAMVANLPERPPYFTRSVAINLRGAAFLSDFPAPTHLRLAEYNQLKEEGATILDVRPGPLFGDGHAANSLNIGIASPSFLVWSGFFVNPDLPIVPVVESETQAQQAQLELARIGFDQVAGFITADDLDKKQQVSQIGARDFLTSLESPQRPVILDVRSAQEWSQDHLEGAIHIPLPQLLGQIGGLSRNAPLTLLCGSGYRSSIAASLLESKGFEQLTNVMGGMSAVRGAVSVAVDRLPSTVFRRPF